MAARAGMANLVLRLRGLTDAGVSDYTIAGVTYWSDDQLQDVLDQCRTEVAREELVFQEEYAGAGTVEYHNYYNQHRNFEEAASGPAAWRVEDSLGAPVGTAEYTPNYSAGNIRFAADTEGETYYLTARVYDLNRAAAEIWRCKGAAAAKGYGFSADGATFNRQQAFEHCLRMAEYYQNGVRPMKVTRLFRSDAATDRYAAS